MSALRYGTAPSTALATRRMILKFEKKAKFLFGGVSKFMTGFP